MGQSHELDHFEMTPARLEREWLIRVQTPSAGVSGLLDALKREIPLRQGHYDQCVFVTAAGYQRFRALDGAHAGAEGTIQHTEAVEITFSIPSDRALLNRVFETLFAAHVNEEPTIHVQEVWGSRSKYVDDKDNPNRYWNRPDAKAIHGTVAG